MQETFKEFTAKRGHKKGTHPDTGITPGKLGKLLKPRSGDYLDHHKATFRDKLLHVGTHIQRTQRASTSTLTPRQIQCTRLTLAYSIYPEWGLACHDMGSLLYTSRGHANSQTRTALKAPNGHPFKSKNSHTLPNSSVISRELVYPKCYALASVLSSNYTVDISGKVTKVQLSKNVMLEVL